MDKEEAKQLADYMNRIADITPMGLTTMLDSLTFAMMDLLSFYRFGKELKDFDKAVAFARSIPKFEDLTSDEFFEWLLNDVQHLDYMSW